jgi:predicted transcriptional regulator
MACLVDDNVGFNFACAKLLSSCVVQVYNCDVGKSDSTNEYIQLISYSSILLRGQMVTRMGRRRGEVRILIDILGICVKGVKVTHLMYKANLSYYTLHRYLATMSEQGLIVKVCDGDGSDVYSVTEKGRLVLDKLREVEHILRAS